VGSDYRSEGYKNHKTRIGIGWVGRLNSEADKVRCWTYDEIIPPLMERVERYKVHKDRGPGHADFSLEQTVLSKKVIFELRKSGRPDALIFEAAIIFHRQASKPLRQIGEEDIDSILTNIFELAIGQKIEELITIEELTSMDWEKDSRVWSDLIVDAATEGAVRIPSRRGNLTSFAKDKLRARYLLFSNNKQLAESLTVKVEELISSWEALERYEYYISDQGVMIKGLKDVANQVKEHFVLVRERLASADCIRDTPLIEAANFDVTCWESELSNTTRQIVKNNKKELDILQVKLTACITESI